MPAAASIKKAAPANNLIFILKSRIIAEKAGMVMNCKDIDLLFGYDLVNNPVISENHFPKIVII